jgi:hypothetical protein
METSPRRKRHRRRWKRYKLKGGAIVLLHKPKLIEIGKPKLVELGPVIDISMGGLAVQYVESDKRMFESTELSVSIPSTGVLLSGIVFRQVSDQAIAELPDGKKIRNRSVEFINLNPQQNHRLETFIREYSLHLTQDRRSGVERRQFQDPKFEDDDYHRLYNRRSGKDRRVIVAAQQ